MSKLKAVPNVGRPVKSEKKIVPSKRTNIYDKSYVDNQRIVDDIPDPKKYVNVTEFTQQNELSRLGLYQILYANRFSHSLKCAQGVYIPRDEAEEAAKRLQDRKKKSPTSVVKTLGVLKPDEAAINVKIKNKYLNAVQAILRINNNSDNAGVYLSNILDEALEKDNMIKQILNLSLKDNKKSK